MSTNRVHLLKYSFFEEERKYLQSELSSRKMPSSSLSVRSGRPLTPASVSLSSELNKLIFLNQQKQKKLDSLTSICEVPLIKKNKVPREDVFERIKTYKQKIEDEMFTTDQLCHMLRTLSKQLSHLKQRNESILKDTKRLSVYTPSVQKTKNKAFSALHRAETLKWKSENQSTRHKQQRNEQLTEKKSTLATIRSEIKLLDRKIVENERSSSQVHIGYKKTLQSLKDMVNDHEHYKQTMSQELKNVQTTASQIRHLKE